MTELEPTYPIPGPHDRRCELSVGWLQRRAEVCRCARRRVVRDLSVAMGNAAFVSHEALVMSQPLESVELMAMTIERLMRAVRTALDEASRELIPTSLTITTAHDRILDSAAIKVEALTLPTGTLHDEAVLEVAADWVARKQTLRS